MLGKGIEFHTDILDEALSMAEEQGKFVFIDTYAPWCGPCKRMNKVFSDPKVGEYFNEKFINVKINMDGKLGKDMLIKYDVVWLPTLLILDKDGNVKYRVDKEIRAEDLMAMANNALDPNYTFYSAPVFSKSPIVNNSTSSKIVKTKKSSKKVKTTTVTMPSTPVEDNVVLGVSDLPQKPEKILYVYNDNANSNSPEILFHESYLMMQLMDPRMHAVADKYLATQDDWTTEKNIKFIFDFLENTNSKYFDFLIANRPLFEKHIGADKVKQNLELMVYMRLNNGFPRPDMEEAITLYELVDENSGGNKAYLYFLQRLKMEENHLSFIEVAEDYIRDINPYNHSVIEELVKIKLKNNLKDHAHQLALLEQAFVMDSDNPNIMLLKARVLLQMDESEKATVVANKALDLAIEKNLNTSQISSFLSVISQRQSN